MDLSEIAKFSLRIVPRNAYFVAVLICAFSFCTTASSGKAASDGSGSDDARAVRITHYTQDKFYLDRRSLYARSVANRSPDMSWGNGIELTNLVAATRHDPKTYGPVLKDFTRALDAYWDYAAPLHGYDPAITSGDGNDKYYDDNEWFVIAFVEAYEVTGDKNYLARARQTLDFVLGGWDDAGGGGILWHERPKVISKNTCSNGPAAVACLRLARYEQPAQAAIDLAWAERIVAWTDQHLQGPSGLFWDHIDADTGKIDRDLLTYNTALMIRANLGLWRATALPRYRDEAARLSKAADWFVDAKTGGYRDAPKWSHLMAEADLELGRTLNDTAAMKRARGYADFIYTKWSLKPPDELIENASIARLMWLIVDSENPVGKKFWHAGGQD